MERFMTKGKGSAIMSKDYFMRQRSGSGDASTKSEEIKATPSPNSGNKETPPQLAPTSTPSFNGSASRKATLGAGSQIMSKDYFRIRPKGEDGSSPVAAPSPPSLRRAETWTAGISSEDVACSGELAAPSLNLIEKRRKEEEMLEKKHEEAISLWREIEGEALDALVLEVPSETEDEEPLNDASSSSPSPSPVVVVVVVDDDKNQHQHHDQQQHAAHQHKNLPSAEPNEDERAEARKNDKNAADDDNNPRRIGRGEIDRRRSTVDDEEQDISDLGDITESNGVSEREDNGGESTHHSQDGLDSKMKSDEATSSSGKPSVRRDNNTPGDNKGTNGVSGPVRRASALPAGRKKPSGDVKASRKLKRASVLGVGKEEAKRESDDDDDDDDNDEEESEGTMTDTTTSTTSTKSSNRHPERPTKRPGLYVGRFYSSLRRRTHLTSHGSDTDDDDQSEKGKIERKMEKKREKEEKAERKRKQKEEEHDRKVEKRQREKGATKGTHDGHADQPHSTNNNNNNNNNKADLDDKENDPYLDRRGTMPKNFKMHFMEKLKSGETPLGDENNNKGEERSEKKKDKKNKRRKKTEHRQSSAQALSYSEPEADTGGKDRLVFNNTGNEGEGGEGLRKKLLKAQKKNKEQEEKIKKQHNELERMRKELERVRRQRKERRRKEREGDGSVIDGGGGKDEEDGAKKNKKNKKDKKTSERGESEGSGREDAKRKGKRRDSRESEGDDLSSKGGKSKKKA